MSEVSMRNTMKKHFEALGPTCHWTRIEFANMAGIPDINICYEGREIWIEAKQMDEEDLPKRDSTPVRIGLKPEQALWLDTRQRAGGEVMVIAKIGREWFIFRSCFFALAKGMPLNELRLATCYNGNWSGAFEVSRVLLGETT